MTSRPLRPRPLGPLELRQIWAPLPSCESSFSTPHASTKQRWGRGSDPRPPSPSSICRGTMAAGLGSLPHCGPPVAGLPLPPSSTSVTVSHCPRLRTCQGGIRPKVESDRPPSPDVGPDMTKCKQTPAAARLLRAASSGSPRSRAAGARHAVQPLRGPAPTEVRGSLWNIALQRTHNFLPFLVEFFIFQNVATGEDHLTASVLCVQGQPGSFPVSSLCAC